MRMKDQLRFVRQNMKKNKTRVYMTILATAMGCAFLIVLTSVGFGIHKSIVKDMTEQRVVTEIEVQSKESLEGEFAGLTDKDIAVFEKLEDVKAVTRRQALQQGLFKAGKYEITPQTYVAHIPSEIKAGFELSKGSLPKADNEIIVGYDFGKQMVQGGVKSEELYDKNGIKAEYQFKGNLAGRKIDLIVSQWKDGREVKKTFPLVIAGVAEKPAKKWMTDSKVMISEVMLRKIEAFTGTPKGIKREPDEKEVPLSGEISPYDEVRIYAKNLEAVEGINDHLKKENYLTYSVVDEMKQINMVFLIVKAGLIIIGTIAILIASIGIYNTMTMAVTERAADIGIMKAIGASPKTIKSIFLLESSYIGIWGALIGTAAAFLVSLAVNAGIPLIIRQFFNEEPPEGLMFSYIPLSLPLICVIICCAVTVISGHRPAKRATNVDVLSALRREI
ncbi:ABC transporter permease [Peribacillus sp. SCS-37]|uniref:ABC transporter permease n=1 Tax=Paraperibacillus esterisolvens TaxID=3115296 RepID=UPI0039061989